MELKLLPALKLRCKNNIKSFKSKNLSLFW